MSDMNNPPPPPPVGFPVTVSGQYVKDFSFENPNAPQIFASTQTAPEMTMGVNITTRSVGQDAFEVTLSLKVDAKAQNKTAFIAEIDYTGIFNLPPVSEEQTRYFLLAEAPRLLFPFARSIVVNAIRDGGFPHVMINPVDFYSLYMSNKDKVGAMPAVGAA